ncbi:MAG: cytochrome c biogenesis protein CcsA [Dehalococcoidia bacterium]|jgi:cytochrome c-type biogenesis protein CcmF|nr:cytochrome c biogenesis protein CcsA [Dehalococcoidia bacterium]HCH36037.1 cytochrome C biogenesis protein [Dehalococcoidia bacterium]|tara:strand:+ start:6533 stop:8485 length:1953 start_codon:yes stop_codon:yes gene_type:complete
MANLGTSTLLIALLLNVYCISMAFFGAKKDLRSAVLSARNANYLVTFSLLIAVCVLVAAFLQHDFSIIYVAEHSNLAMPRIYTWVAFYAGNEGSLLFVAFALSLMSSISLSMIPRRVGVLSPYTNGVISVIILFFIVVLISLANPFSAQDLIPVDGKGINPLLTHPGMFIHPPMIMTGLISISVPFSLAMAGLISGQINDDWVDIGRVWGLVAWVLLAIGLLLGSWWAYTILGWGGYWAWDPVENAAFMPWLGLTAFIHSIMVQKRRGMFRMWNIALINISFALGAFGIFINRGGPVPSVHSFGASTLGWVFLLFLAVSTIISFGLFFYRMSLLKGSTSLESALSRETAFLVNNLFLLAIAFFTLWGVVFPIISEITTGETITVGEPYYNQVNGPLMLGLICLMGIGPLLPWRKSNLSQVNRILIVPLVSTTIVVIAISLLFQITKPIVIIGIAVSTLAAISVFQEWIRGTKARQSSTGRNYLLAFCDLILANRPRYGGYIVHIAIIMLAFGILGSSFYNSEKDVFLAIGESTEIEDYSIEFTGIRTEIFPDRTERIADLKITKGDNELGSIGAWQGIYPSFSMLSTRAAIRSTPIEDLYVIFSETQPDGKTAAFRILVNPLVWWMWLSGPFVILGTIVALWPARKRTII